MKYFSVPADFKKETIDRYDKLNRQYPGSKIIETYGNITVGNYFESGRPANVLPRADLADLEEYIRYSKSKHIDYNYTINATHLENREFSRKGILEIMTFLGKLNRAGVRSLTIALPTLIDLVKASPYEFKIKASTLCSIDNASKARAFKKMGMERIVADESINREFGTLKRVREEFGEKVEIIVNAICHKNCTYRWYHYNQMSSDSVKVDNKVSLDYYPMKCLKQRYQEISDILKLTWVRPEDIKYYTATGISYFKLQGRQAVIKGDPVRAVEAYMKETYEGDLFELLDMFDPTSSFRVFTDNKKLDGYIKPFYEKAGFCRHECTKCNYCESFAHKAIDKKEAEKVIGMTNNYFAQVDTYQEMVKSVLTIPGEAEQETELEVEFDIG
ncbi:MAG: hypothetical protein GY757_02540 [bacterium]|nr:hypothetical protein [bacterium]